MHTQNGFDGSRVVRTWPVSHDAISRQLADPNDPALPVARTVSESACPLMFAAESEMQGRSGDDGPDSVKKLREGRCHSEATWDLERS